MKLGFSMQSRYSLPMEQVLPLLAEAGFCAVSPGWERNGDFIEAVEQARKNGLLLQSLHGPLRGMPAMWSRDPDVAKPIFQDLMQSASDCAELGIPILVVHPWNGVDYRFSRESLSFRQFDALVSHCQALGITLAFENLEGPEFLTALMERYSHVPAVGFCWDSGHERCYTPSWDPLRAFGHRLVMTHLNDNLGVTDPGGRLQGTDDLHLLPYHGNLDWDRTVQRLRAAKPQDTLNFEFKIRPKGDRCTLDLYSHMPLKQYFQEAYRRGCQAVSSYFQTP